MNLKSSIVIECRRAWLTPRDGDLKSQLTVCCFVPGSLFESTKLGLLLKTAGIVCKCWYSLRFSKLSSHFLDRYPLLSPLPEDISQIDTQID
jgi:hypothetical protein